MSNRIKELFDKLGYIPVFDENFVSYEKAALDILLMAEDIEEDLLDRIEIIEIEGLYYVVCKK